SVESIKSAFSFENGMGGRIFGAELVLDREKKTPAPDIATKVIHDMRARGVLMGKIGVHQCATQIRPPMPFSKENADLL
ncbi:hypothetical protein ACC734_39860, partial [Rhizobium ruizarguesonis]